jgi:hypothetical protein
MDSAFWVWTFIHDVSGIARAELKYRIDADGANDTATDHNELYAGGPDVGPWQTIAMSRRVFPKGNYLNDPNIDFTVLPDHIADEYYVQISDLSEVLIDYYVEAQDSVGHVKRSPIQHVWIGQSTGTPSHAIDGSLDSTATLVASNGGLDLYADWDGEFLYVATQGVGATAARDHFIIVGTDLDPTVAAPWAKAGTVAERTLYLGNEDGNNWSGWFGETENLLTSDAESAAGSYLEGLVRLASHLSGTLPDGVYLAVGAYGTDDGDPLEAQSPAGDGDGGIEAEEYVYFPLAVTGAERGFPGAMIPELLPARPNPFGSTTRIELAVPAPQKVSVAVYDVRGRRVRSLYSNVMGEGRHALAWNGRSDRGDRVPAGVYFVHVTTRGGSLSRKIVLIR